MTYSQITLYIGSPLMNSGDRFLVVFIPISIWFRVNLQAVVNKPVHFLCYLLS